MEAKDKNEILANYSLAPNSASDFQKQQSKSKSWKYTLIPYPQNVNRKRLRKYLCLSIIGVWVGREELLLEQRGKPTG